MRPAKDTDPLALPLLAGIAIAVLWPLSHFFGVSNNAFTWALAIFAFYSGAIVLTLVIFGFFYCIGWLATFIGDRGNRGRRRSSN